MREIEKGLLLAEFFEVDTSKYVPSFIEWIKLREQYLNFEEKYLALKTKSPRSILRAQSAPRARP